MRKEKKLTQAILLSIPLLTIIWGIILSFISGPFYISRSDPEYVYLLNGMNVALFEFDRIGHADHPGTPFQVITGVFIRLIYLFSGKGSLVEDVITNPEKYLSISSFFLSVITAILFYKISVQEYLRNRNYFGALIVPFVFACFLILIDLPSRYNPDRALMILVLLYSLCCIRYIYHDLSKKKFAIYSGIILAVGLMTKINFFPFLILPLFLIPGLKRKITYGISLAASTLIFFIAIHHKFTEFWSFTLGVMTRDGLHGTGKETLLNLNSFVGNLEIMVTDNFALLFFVSVILSILILFFLKKSLRSVYKKEFLFILAYIVISLISIVIVAKHYKSSYLIPVMSMSGLAAYIVWSLSIRIPFLKYIPHILFSTGFIFILINVFALTSRYQKRNLRLNQDLMARDFIRQNLSPQDYFFIEPSWVAGPTIINGLVYGMSYIDKKSYHFNELEKVYPNVITYEGPRDTLSHFRMVEANTESILKSGFDFYILSTPERHAPMLVHYLDSCARNFNIPLGLDTVFSNASIQQHILKVKNQGSWSLVFDVACGFENELNERMISNDGQIMLRGPYNKSDKRSADGKYDLMLDQQQNQSPEICIPNVSKGDYILVSIKRQRGADPENSRLNVSFDTAEKDKILHFEDTKLCTVSSHWELLRLAITLDEQPVDGKLHCYFEYAGHDNVLVDDFRVQHYSKQNCENDEPEE